MWVDETLRQLYDRKRNNNKSLQHMQQAETFEKPQI